MTGAWLWLAGAAAAGFPLAGRAAPAPDADLADATPIAARERLSPRTLALLAAAGSAALSLLLFGVSTGLLLALVTVPATVVGVSWLGGRPARARPDTELALTLDLIAVSLRSGQPLATALVLAAPSGDVAGDRLLRVAGLLRLGADPREAWRAVEDDPVLAPVAAAARRSSVSGARLAAAFERLATEVRDEIGSQAQARAQRVGVLTAAPLGLCFLPAFVCLGVAPIIIGIAGTVLRGVQ